MFLYPSCRGCSNPLSPHGGFILFKEAEEDRGGKREQMGTRNKMFPVVHLLWSPTLM